MVVVASLAAPTWASDVPSASTKTLRGRFLHLTDLHPDPHYTRGAWEADACHRRNSHPRSFASASNGFDPDDLDDRIGLELDRGRRAGYFGLASSECDSPIALINSTLSFLSTEFSLVSHSDGPPTSAFDFLVWTGDNARHDLDDHLPRTLPEILELNSFVADQIRSSLGDDLAVVASVGNNDVWPHNIMFPGPSKITTSLLDLWTTHNFVPEQMKHTFARGGYYSHEVVPDKLLLISLNTIYFFEKNTAVDGCPAVDELTRAAFWSRFDNVTIAAIDPGSEQLLWLEQQLYLAHERGMQVWLSGHVPPEPGNWYEPCLDRYSELVIRYGGNVLGQLFGHMNQDHFSFLTLPSSSPRPASPPISTLQSSSLPKTLYKQFKHVLPRTPSEIRKHAWKLAPIHVSPSVIPTYLPTFRIWEYQVPSNSITTTSLAKMTTNHHQPHENRTLAKVLPNPSTPSSPCRTLSEFTPTSYTQFYIPLENFEQANKEYETLYLNSSMTTFESWEWERSLVEKVKGPRWEIEYTTLPKEEVIERLLDSIEQQGQGGTNLNQEREMVFRIDFMPRKIREWVDRNRGGERTFKRTKTIRSTLEKLLEEHDLVPFEIPSTSSKPRTWFGFGNVLNKNKRFEPGLTVDNWIKLGTRLVESRDEYKRSKRRGKGRKHRDKKRNKRGMMWKNWVERMGVRTGQL
ncbi:uncharacterized protein JCM15063_002812 [Sporobolomyces koalae]|uniref:uncharacterized protein n=1 Tax=Sporobolomyces koalae TaxID=500713 RepID=UPI003180ECE7